MYRETFFCRLLSAIAKLKAAAAKQQCQHKYKAGGIYVKVKAFDFAATATQKQNDQQNPSAVAAAKQTAVVAAAAAAAVIKHSVKHFYLHLSVADRRSI